MKIGVIAEENNDVEVLAEITRKLIPENSFSIAKFVGHGCGKLRKKCGPWARNLASRGCDLLVVLHDLDRAVESQLRSGLEGAVVDSTFKGKLILIPIEELEAWLLADAAALKATFTMSKQPNTPANPELIQSPKEFLRDLVWKSSKKRYVNTVHNRKIAKNLNLDALKNCKTYAAYPKFLSDHFQMG